MRPRRRSVHEHAREVPQRALGRLGRLARGAGPRLHPCELAVQQPHDVLAQLGDHRACRGARLEGAGRRLHQVVRPRARLQLRHRRVQPDRRQVEQLDAGQLGHRGVDVRRHAEVDDERRARGGAAREGEPRRRQGLAVGRGDDEVGGAELAVEVGVGDHPYGGVGQYPSRGRPRGHRRHAALDERAAQRPRVAAGPDDEHARAAPVAHPVRGQVERELHDRLPALGDAADRADLARGRRRALEQPLERRRRRPGALGVRQRAPHLPGDLALAEHHRVEPGGDREQVRAHAAAGDDPHAVAQLLDLDTGRVGDVLEQARRIGRVVDVEVELVAVARRQRHPTASSGGCDGVLEPRGESFEQLERRRAVARSQAHEHPTRVGGPASGGGDGSSRPPGEITAERAARGDGTPRQHHPVRDGGRIET